MFIYKMTFEIKSPPLPLFINMDGKKIYPSASSNKKKYKKKFKKEKSFPTLNCPEVDLNVKMDGEIKIKSCAHLVVSNPHDAVRGFAIINKYLETIGECVKRWEDNIVPGMRSINPQYLIGPHKRIGMSDNLGPLVVELLKSHKAGQEEEKENDKSNEPENEEKDNKSNESENEEEEDNDSREEEEEENEEMDVFSNYTTSSSSPSSFDNEINNRDERYVDAYHAVCDHFHLEADMFRPVFRGMTIIEDICTAYIVTTESARSAILFEYPNPSRWWYDDEREEYVREPEGVYDKDDAFQGRKVVFKFLDYYCEDKGCKMEEWRKEGLQEATMLKELGDMGGMKVPKLVELVELDEFGMFALVMEHGGYDLCMEFCYGIGCSEMIWVCDIRVVQFI